MSDRSTKWLKFLRQYGPIARNDNMYDETIQRSGRRAGIRPVTFVHPLHDDVLRCFVAGEISTSVILTGTAGDGKSHLCREVWEALKGDNSLWNSNDPHLKIQIDHHPKVQGTLHILRDLSAWVPQRNTEWSSDKAALLQQFCRSVYDSETCDFFLIAANDGQLVETWRRLPDAPHVAQVRNLLESLLVEDRRQEEGARLKLFNLSQSSSVELLDRALENFLGHEEWDECYDAADKGWTAFDNQSPIRYNYELLKTPLVQQRLRSLFELCDYNELHIPIRQILLLLANAVLGHPDVSDKLMTPADVLTILRARTVSKASLYNNVFGGNLSEARRDSITVFDYLNRFRIGFETSNRVDNILIFGNADDILRPYFNEFLSADIFYGADEIYLAAQRNYVEGADDEETTRNALFLEQLVSQRRGLFFKIPEDKAEELHLWELTVFHYAGEYLSRVVKVLKLGERIERPILARMVRGLNRVFIGMLVTSDRDLLLATSLSFSHAKVSRMLEDIISVTPRLGEKVEISLCNGIPVLNVVLSNEIHCMLELHLTRYEFLSRVAEGALPGSFSKECYEDILAFKSRVLAGLAKRRQQYSEPESLPLAFRLLNLDEHGNPSEEVVEVIDAG